MNIEEVRVLYTTDAPNDADGWRFCPCNRKIYLGENRAEQALEHLAGCPESEFEQQDIIEVLSH